ncbi:MAG TPA: caspase family protein [Syntrophales bacterium]|nr:caspase family protein [Syntrophales bacterium]HOI16485.1 caspase family protein [Geobacteraceae bacterium]
MKFLISKGADLGEAIAVAERLAASNPKEGVWAAAVKRLEKFVPKQEAGSAASAAVSNNEARPSHTIKSDIDDLPAASGRRLRNSYAIVIGIESYRQKLPKADFAVNDAKLMGEYLSKVMSYPEENIVIMMNEHATKSDFEKYFEQWLANHVERDSTLFIYYSGHGAPNPKTGDAYLVPYDGDPSFIAQTGYPLKKLYDALGKLPAKEIIVALDAACFSGAGGRSVLAEGARPLVMNLEKAVSVPKNMTVMAAASGEQISSTQPTRKKGMAFSPTSCSKASRTRASSGPMDRSCWTTCSAM